MKLLSVIRTVVLGGVLLLGGAVAQAQSPLLMAGKETLFQRVLVRDGGPRFVAPDQPSGETVYPLQPFWVYERQGDWVQVGADETGAELFWLPQDSVIDWKQNIVATFEGSANIDRLLFFRDLDAAYEVVESEAPAVDAGRLRQQALRSESGGVASEKVVALGPRETVDLRKNLYVMPILSTEEAVFENGSFVNLLEVAVAQAKARNDDQIAPAEGSEEDIRRSYKSAVVFVVDTTVSMQPYINATREALIDIFNQTNLLGTEDAISFGLIGYRDNLRASPGLEYDVKTFVTLEDGSHKDRFLAGIDLMTEARESSANFREDAYAGVEYALSAMDWRGFGARFIVLVTDAGPREATDELSSTGLSAAGLNSMIKERLGAAIAVMHLRSPKGKRDHASAEAAYRELASLPNLSPLYFPIENGNPKLYRQSAQALGELIAGQVLAFRSGKEENTPDPQETTLSAVGRTMQLAYLGAKKGVKAPDVFRAVVADRDFQRTGLKPLSIRLLLNKSELSDLEQALRIIVTKSEENVIDPDKFFAQVLGAAADMSRTPGKVSRRGSETLAQAAAIDEYIEDLPYKSRIMAITEDDWIRMSISEQQTIVNELYEKMERYRRYNEATDSWVDFMGAGGRADQLVYPIPLDDLP